MNSKVTEKILNKDSLAEAEQIFGGKHWSEFSDEERVFALLKAFCDNQVKAEHLKSIGDTYWGIKWNDFITLIESYGFKKGMKYDFIPPKHGLTDEPDRIEEAIIFYHPGKGLILWATSYGNKDHINGGTVYGMTQYEKFDWDIFSHCSHGDNGEDKNIRDFSYDIREGLIYTLNRMDKNTRLLPIWSGRKPFMFLVDYAESEVKGYNYKAITNNKLKMCPEEMQEIFKNCN